MKHSQKKECLRHLRETFGLSDYRPGQKEAVSALLSGRDVMCILPTGAGKSLCWQLPALVHDGLTVVVSPLIALMRDQVQHLQASGIVAVSLDSLMTQEERAASVALIRQGRAKILYVSPERLKQPSFQRLCREVLPWMLVVDEAHCVVQWGEKFRPAYADLAEFVSNLPKRPVLCALTATADDAMQQAVRTNLGMKRPKRILLPVVRGNLVYDIRTTLNRTDDLIACCTCEPCKTVVFCRSRARTEYLVALLTSAGVRAEYYHAGLERHERIQVQDRFMAGEIEVLCATSAFGLGVDIPDIRRVIHDYLPDSLIDYVQQSGRAGRDGDRAECLLLMEPNELVRKAAFRSYERNPLRRLMAWYKYHCNLKPLLRVVMQETCVTTGIARSFSKRTNACGKCSACRKGPLVSKAPKVAFRKVSDLRLWVLKWQRDALAQQRGCRADKIVSERALGYAAQKLVFPQDVYAPEEMARLLSHFRRVIMHKSAGNGIS